MFPLLTQGFPTAQSKPSCTHFVKLLTPGVMLLDLLVTSTVHHFKATSVTTVHPQIPFLSTMGFLCPSLKATMSCWEKMSCSPVLACCQHPQSNPKRHFCQSLESLNLPLVDSFSTSHCSVLVYTVFPHTSADDLDSAFSWEDWSHSKPIVYKALTRNSWNCLGFIPIHLLVWL